MPSRFRLGNTPLRPAAMVLAVAVLAACPGYAEDAGNRTGGMILGGVLGGSLGFALGASLYDSDAESADGLRELERVFKYGSVGGALGLGVGVHLGNGSRGDLLTVVGTSAAVGLGGFLFASSGDNGAAFLALPFFQLGASLLVESRTADGNRAAARSPAAPEFSAALLPTPRGVGLALSGTF